MNEQEPEDWWENLRDEEIQLAADEAFAEQLFEQSHELEGVPVADDISW